MAYGRLDVFWPDGKIEVFILDTPSVSIGRSSGNTIHLDTETISRYHFSITLEDDQVFIADLDSANGTFVDGGRLAANEKRLLDGPEEIQAGHLRILFYPGDDSPTLPMEAIPDDTLRVEREGVNFRLTYEDPEIAVPPGSHTTATITVTNTGSETERYEIDISGLPEGWARANRRVLIVEPQDSEQILVNLKPLRRSGSAPGTYPVQVKVHPVDKPDALLEANLNLEVLSYNGFGMALASPTTGDEGNFRLHLHNQGSVNLPLSLTGRDVNDSLYIDIPSPHITLAPGQRQQIRGRVRTRQRTLFGAPRTHLFDLIARSDDAAAFTAAVRGQLVEKPFLPTWAALSLGGIAVALLVIVALASLGLLQPPPEPEIADFQINSTQIAQGEPLELSWAVTDVASLSISLNATPYLQIDPQISGVEIDTSALQGEVHIALLGVNGEAEASAALDTYIYRPLVVEHITVIPTQLVRNVVQTLSINWQIDGATVTRLSGLESFSTTVVEPTYGSQASVDGIVGIPEDDFTITLFAEDEVGNTLEQQIAITVSNPECTPLTDTVELRAGPHPLHQVVGTVPVNVPVVVDSQDESGTWLRAQLPGAVSGWGLRDTFSCATNFNVDDLRKELVVPPPPTLTPTFTATAIPTPTPTATPPPTVTPLPTSTPSRTVTPLPTTTPTPLPTLTPG